MTNTMTRTDEKTAPCLVQDGVTYIQLNRLRDVVSNPDGTLFAYCDHRCHVVMRHATRFYVVVATDEFEYFLGSTGVMQKVEELKHAATLEDAANTAVVLCRKMTDARGYCRDDELSGDEFKTVGKLTT